MWGIENQAAGSYISLKLSFFFLSISQILKICVNFLGNYSSFKLETWYGMDNELLNYDVENRDAGSY